MVTFTRNNRVALIRTDLLLVLNVDRHRLIFTITAQLCIPGKNDECGGVNVWLAHQGKGVDEYLENLHRQDKRMCEVSPAVSKAISYSVGLGPTKNEGTSQG